MIRKADRVEWPVRIRHAFAVMTAAPA